MPRRKIDDATREEIARLYVEGRTLPEIKAVVGDVSDSSIYLALGRAGITPQRESGRPRSRVDVWEELSERVERHERTLGDHEARLNYLQGANDAVQGILAMVIRGDSPSPM